MMFGKSKALRKLNADLIDTVADQRQHIEKLQRESAEFAPQLRAAHNQIEYLVRTIRQMDDQIFAMSQCTDFNQMRPHFLTLSDGMTARKVAESNRIADILRPQLIETYRPTDAQKKITHN
jgi:hypothetical protein